MLDRLIRLSRVWYGSEGVRTGLLLFTYLTLLELHDSYHSAPDQSDARYSMYNDGQTHGGWGAGCRV